MSSVKLSLVSTIGGGQSQTGGSLCRAERYLKGVFNSHPDLNTDTPKVG